MTLASIRRYDGDSVRTVGDHAVVVGGSVAGLLAARVLADGFERVTVLEKDEYPDDPVTRRGVPQGAHIHMLQEAGKATMEDVLPGYGETLLAAGGVQIDAATDIQFFSEGDFLADGPSRLPTYAASRPLFEHATRQLVAARPRIDVRECCQVTSFRVAGDAAAVDGVAFRDEAGSDDVLDADLVVDATGRASRTPSWLEEHGYAPPPVDEVTVNIGYSTTVVERPPGDRRAILGLAEAPRTRGGAVSPIEDDRWLVNVHGFHGDHPPTDPAGFTEFVETLETPGIADVVASHPRTADIDFYPFPSSRRRYYERLEDFPDGLLVVGDALASFNPVYGQGMSVAALQALALHHTIAAGAGGVLWRRFFDRAADVVDTAWTMAVGADAAYDQTTGPVPRGAAVFNRYVERLTRKAHSDGELRDAFMRVISMQEPPTALFRPGVLARVLSPSGLGWQRASGEPESVEQPPRGTP